MAPLRGRARQTLLGRRQQAAGHSQVPRAQRQTPLAPDGQSVRRARRAQAADARRRHRALFAFGAPDCSNPNLKDPEQLRGPLVFYGEQFLRYGIVTYDLLYQIWVHACHLVTETQLLPLARFVFEKLEFGYSADGLEFNDEYQRHRQHRSRPATGKSLSSATSRASSEQRFADAAREQLGELIFAPNVRCPLPDSARPSRTLVAAYPSLCAVFQSTNTTRRCSSSASSPPPALQLEHHVALAREAIAKHNEAGALTLHCYARRLTPADSSQSVTCVCIRIASGSLFALDELVDGAPQAPAGSSEKPPSSVSKEPDSSIDRLAQLARTPLDKFLVDQLWVHLMPVVNSSRNSCRSLSVSAL